MGLMTPFLKRQPEYAAIARLSGQVIATARGKPTQVENIPWPTVWSERPKVFYHSHPYGIGAFVSGADRRVYTGLTMALGYPFYIVITDFETVRVWYQPELRGDALQAPAELWHEPAKPFLQWGGLWFNLPKFIRGF